MHAFSKVAGYITTLCCHNCSFIATIDQTTAMSVESRTWLVVPYKGAYVTLCRDCWYMHYNTATMLLTSDGPPKRDNESPYKFEYLNADDNSSSNSRIIWMKDLIASYTQEYHNKGYDLVDVQYSATDKRDSAILTFKKKAC
jgi:hypothetical protein